MTETPAACPATQAAACHVEQKNICFVALLTAWMAGRCAEHVAAELLCSPPTVRNWLGTGPMPSTPGRPRLPYLARLFGITEKALAAAIAETDRQRAAAENAAAAASAAEPAADDQAAALAEVLGTEPSP
jgi:hypothetical protein